MCARARAGGTVRGVIGYLSGVAAGPRLVVLPGGIGYVVHTPTELTAGAEVTLYVHTAVSEQAITLYGFPTEVELDLFAALTGVNGVGAKMALALIRDVGVAGIAAAVAAKEPGPLTKASGVGPKVATRVVAELKLPAAAVAAATDAAPAPAGLEAELVVTLETLGYDRVAAERAARAAVADALADGSAGPGELSDGSADAGPLLAAALVHLRGAVA